MADAAARVLRHVPMLDAGEGAVAARAVVRVRGDVADGVDVRVVREAEGLVGAEGAVFFKRDGRVGMQIAGGGGDADAEDDEVGGKVGAVFQVDGADGLGVRRRRVGGFDRGGHVEFHPRLLQRGPEDLSDLGAHDAFERGAFRAHHSHAVLGR